ncbi:hypothetical protein QJS64_17870 [Paraclostridium bifermentans]|uniref:Cell division protein FtsY n=1 Tax=Paraclostridium bifermentans TaxID=1490 RepID=A0ABY8R2K9_PARBF|nr:hypothetical protein QJS64_17870 [Paraclostridium bifermentans]
MFKKLFKFGKNKEEETVVEEDIQIDEVSEESATDEEEQKKN